MIRVLPPAEARKIAAGEVVDRPAALVREFMDNALDSGAASIELAIEGGGIDRVEVIDNGSGMSKEDLVLCTKTHATSKIQSLEDLARTYTLGFRGEALAAASATARLEILTSAGGGEAWLLQTGPGENPESSGQEFTLSPARRTKGTSVRALGLFDHLPARKRFLKREAGEAALCRQVFIEKALAFPELSFRFTQDRRLKLQLLPCRESGSAREAGGETGAVPAPQNTPVANAAENAVENAVENAAASFKTRFGELILPDSQRAFLHTHQGSGRGFTVTAVFGGPELYRQDRKQQYIFVNKRRIQDYGLLQALEYGLGGFFPNSSHPVGAIFVRIDPALADFNIHPAKREVRFADPGAIHHVISSMLREYVHKNTAHFGAYEVFSPSLFSAPPARENPYRNARDMVTLLERREDFAPLPREDPAAGEEPGEYAAEPEEPYSPLRLAGRVFNLFIIAERGNRLYIVDQHAAHERILYNRYLSKPIPSQELLAPIPFNTANPQDDRFLRAKREELSGLGVGIEEDGGGSWRIEALPGSWKMGDGDTVAEILSLQNAGENMAEHWAATLACRGAIKDGDLLDDGAALALVKEVLALKEQTGQMPRCPHGRPLWTEITREELFRAVRRID
ncbi:MAG: DNA mismatch repair endonuclease MutL [Spirochaetaceae bacterium]|jgi:DNA mismatch repair protein MutL|nr:DNA mismatch repair endonuclease MutL [Spirochaetaceae bacterium]